MLTGGQSRVPVTPVGGAVVQFMQGNQGNRHQVLQRTPDLLAVVLHTLSIRWGAPLPCNPWKAAGVAGMKPSLLVSFVKSVPGFTTLASVKTARLGDQAGAPVGQYVAH